MKNFDSTINNETRMVSSKPRLGVIGKGKYIPSFTQEWKNTIYCYNKNNIKNIPINDVNINKIIRNYFNLYFQDSMDINQFIKLRRRRKILRRTYTSNAYIKHTNNKAIITLYTFNREKNILKKKYLATYNKLTKYLIKQYLIFYKRNIMKLYNNLNKGLIYNNKLLFSSNIIRKLDLISYKFINLSKFIKLKHLYLKKIWSVLVRNYSENYLSLSLLRKYDLLYSLNQYKFNKLKLLPILTNIIRKITGKKLEYNIINLSHFAQHPDIFTNILSIQMKKQKKFNVLTSIYSILNKAPIAPSRLLREKSISKEGMNINEYLQKFRDLKIISNISTSDNIENLLNENKTNNHSDPRETISKKIFNSIHYKNMSGIKLQVSGRLTKRYRADRAISTLKWRGGLKNLDASYKRKSTALVRGNSNANVLYSITNSKRKIGSFAVKGWIGTK